MPALYPLTKDAFVLSLGAGAKSRFTLRKGAFEMLLDPLPDVRTRRLPLMLGRDFEAGDVTLSPTGRTVQFRIKQPARLLLANADDARKFVRGELNALLLTDATDNDAAPTTSEEDARARRLAQNERLRALVAKNLPPRAEAEQRVGLPARAVHDVVTGAKTGQ